MRAWFRHRSGLRPSQQPSGEEEKHAQQNRVQKRGTKHTEKLAQIKSKQIYSCEVSLDTIRLKTFLHLSTLMNQKIQDNDNNHHPPPPTLKRGARLANRGRPPSTAHVRSTRSTSGTSRAGTEVFPGSHLSQGPASPPPGPSPLPPHLSAEAYLAPRRPPEKLIPVGI